MPLALDAACVRTLRALAPTVTCLVLSGVRCELGDLPLLVGALGAGLRVLSLAKALSPDEDFYDRYDACEIDTAPGNHDSELLQIARACPQLQNLDLSGHSDNAYVYFSEAGLMRAVQEIPTLRALYLYGMFFLTCF